MGPTAALLILLAGSARRAMDCVCSRSYSRVTEDADELFPRDSNEDSTGYPKEVFAIDLNDLQQFCDPDTETPFFNDTCPNGTADVVHASHNLMTSQIRRTSPALSLGGQAWCRMLLQEAGDPLPLDTLNDLLWEEAAEWLNSSSPHWLYDAEWNDDTLTLDGHRGRFVSCALHTHRQIKRAMSMSDQGVSRDFWKTGPMPQTSDVPRYYSKIWRGVAKLFSIDVAIITQSFIPLAYQHLVNNTTQHQLRNVMKNIASLWNLLEVRFTGLVDDLLDISDQVENYEVEADRMGPFFYILRRPLLSEKLLEHHEVFLFLHEDFGPQCEQQVPGAAQMLSFAEAVYRQFGLNLVLHYLDSAYGIGVSRFSDEEWLLGDRNESIMSVDTDCVQLLVDLLENPSCPLVELPRETTQRHQQCRLQLWKDIVRGGPYIPVTSYLAYTQRINVNICLLSWMVANPNGICQDVPMTILTSVREAHCLFSNSSVQLCQEVNFTEAICYVARALLLLQCPGLHSSSSQKVCTLIYGQHRFQPRHTKLPLERKVNYRHSLNTNTLKYKDFKIEYLKGLEMSFIALNVLFRLLTASVYLLLPQLRNLPGRLLFCFQLTGIIQILCSEVVYRVAGLLDLPSVVVVDSSLTLLSCMWLNTFCYRMYACIRHLRLLNHMHPAQVKKIFCAQLMYVMTAWVIITATCITIERMSEDYLVHSRVLFLAALSLTVAANLVLLGLVGYMRQRRRGSLKRLNVSCQNKPVSKKEAVLMSVKAVILSGVGVIVRVGFHQAQGLAQVVYYVHIATMEHGPLLFVLFACNGTALPLLRNRLLVWWKPGVIDPGQEFCSSAERNARRRDLEQPLTEESPV